MDENHQDWANHKVVTTEDKIWLPLSYTDKKPPPVSLVPKKKGINWGVADKSFWELLLLLGTLLAALGAIAIPVAIAWFSYQQNQTSLQISERQHQTDISIAADQQRAAILQTYIDNTQDLLLNHNLLKSKPDDDVAILARARTLTALEGLDPERRGFLVRFLSEAQLISGKNTIISLDDAILSGADLSDIDLSNSHLSKANLIGTNLTGTNLTGANLTGANLTKADLHGANLHKTNLSGANLSEAKLFPVVTTVRIHPRVAILFVPHGTNLSGANLSYANLYKANLRGANLNGADLHEADLSYADLSGAEIEEFGGVPYPQTTDMRNTNLQWVILDGTKLNFVDLSNADLRGADLENVILTYSILDHANLEGATGYGNEDIGKKLKEGNNSLKGTTMPDGSKHP